MSGDPNSFEKVRLSEMCENICRNVSSNTSERRFYRLLLSPSRGFDFVVATVCADVTCPMYANFVSFEVLGVHRLSVEL